MKVKDTIVPIWDGRRPRTLFSGLMECGGGFSKVSQTAFGCSAARNKGPTVCTSRATVSQNDLERLVLDALQNDLLDQEALCVFCAEYARERNRLRTEAADNRATMEKELAAANRDHAKLVDAIVAGIPADQVKDRMNALDAKRTELETKLAGEPVASPIRIHPKMAEGYREKVRALIDQLQRKDGMLEAKAALRGLIDRIVLVPDPDTGGLAIHLEGALAALLSLSTGQTTDREKRRTQATDITEGLVLVAGGRIGLCRTGRN
ncbi:hypothetical protein PARPLA_00015 [Rhodobacteraceae bacterium THAF1]|nr:hypothetical protein FIU81_00735 [Palleronia sp. THAF1]VDC16572.1 hypothetical protein PARPLA_00015 [Rhodobacteraceae bacterium THAF1]